jgi:hypothetical protein
VAARRNSVSLYHDPDAVPRVLAVTAPWLTDAERDDLLEECKPRQWNAQALADELNLTNAGRGNLKVRTIVACSFWLEGSGSGALPICAVLGTLRVCRALTFETRCRVAPCILSSPFPSGAALSNEHIGFDARRNIAFPCSVGRGSLRRNPYWAFL